MPILWKTKTEKAAEEMIESWDTAEKAAEDAKTAFRKKDYLGVIEAYATMQDELSNYKDLAEQYPGITLHGKPGKELDRSPERIDKMLFFATHRLKYTANALAHEKKYELAIKASLTAFGAYSTIRDRVRDEKEEKSLWHMMMHLQNKKTEEAILKQGKATE